MKKILLLCGFFLLGCSESQIPDFSGYKKITLVDTLYFQFSDTVPIIKTENVLDTTFLGLRVKNVVEPCNSISFSPRGHDHHFSYSCFVSNREKKSKLVLIFLERSYDSSELTEEYIINEAEGFYQVKVDSIWGYASIAQPFKHGIDTLHFIKKELR